MDSTKKLKIWPLCIYMTHRMHTDRVRVPLSSRNQEKQGSKRLTTVSVTSKCAISKKLEASCSCVRLKNRKKNSSKCNAVKLENTVTEWQLLHLESLHLIIWCHKGYFQCPPQIIMDHLLKGKFHNCTMLQEGDKSRIQKIQKIYSNLT